MHRDNETTDDEKSRFVVPPLVPLWAVAALGVTVAASIALLTWLVPYNQANYRYTLSAALQALAAIFALAAAGTFLVAQIAESATGRLVPFLPRRAAAVVALVVTATMALDLVVLVGLPGTVSGARGVYINGAVAGNGVGLFFVLAYIAVALQWLRPETHLAALLSQLKQFDKPEDQRTALIAIEELGLRACDRRQLQTCMDVVAALQQTAPVLLEKRSDVKVVMGEPAHPVRFLPECLGRLGTAYAEKGLEDAIPPLAWSYVAIASAYCMTDERLVDVEISMPMQDVVEACAKYDRRSALYNFLANKSASLRWLADSGTHEAVRLFALNIEDEVAVCAEHQLVDACGEVVEELGELCALASQDKLRDYFHHGEGRPTPFAWNAYLQQLADSIEAKLRQYDIQERVPRFGDRSLLAMVTDARRKLAPPTGTA